MKYPADLELAFRCFQAGQFAEAERICTQIVAANLALAGAWHLLGIIALQAGNHSAALQHLTRAAQADPEDAEICGNRGIVLMHLGQWQAAIDSFRRATQLQPLLAQAHYNLGNALYQAGNLNEAIASFQQASALEPGFSEADFSLGLIYHRQNRDAEAIDCYHRVLKANSEHAAAHANLGTIYKNQECFDQSAECFRRALELQPLNAEHHYNLACMALANSDLALATGLFTRAIAMQPAHAEARYNRATLLLLTGDFRRGWPEFEWRWQTEQQRPRSFAQPRWQGESLAGRTILLWAEQGLGDTIQFVRYATLVKQRGARVIVECPAPLHALLRSFRDCDQLIRQSDRLPAFDVQAPLLSLPGIFQTALDTIPAAVPYLFAEPSLVDYWRNRLARMPGVRIGINWCGRPGRGIYRQRDIPLPCFASLTDVPVHFISLQQGPVRDELARFGSQSPIVDPGENLDTVHGPFMDTAAIIKNLHLVITSDTAIAHLAGALGCPTWLALPFLPDWRWLLDRNDSPWYSTMRLFRQRSAGNWIEVFDEIRSALLSWNPLPAH